MKRRVVDDIWRRESLFGEKGCRLIYEDGLGA